jgi:hypothetical protein
MRKLALLGGWLANIGRRNPDRLLKLLIRAHDMDREEASMAMAFRAGVRIGLKYPHLGREVLGEPDWTI